MRYLTSKLIILLVLLVGCDGEKKNPTIETDGTEQQQTNQIAQDPTTSLKGTSNDYLSGDEFFIKNITIIDGLGNAQQANQDIHIKDGKILSISNSGKNSPPADKQVIDGTGLTAMP